MVFTLRFHGIERSVDLSDLPCPRLVRPLAAALASIGGDDGALRTWNPDFLQMVRHLRTLRRFRRTTSGASGAAGGAGGAAGAGGAGQFGLRDVAPQMLDGFARPVGPVRAGQFASLSEFLCNSYMD